MFIDSKELRDILNQHPNIPVIFSVDNDLYCDEGYSSLANKARVKLGQVTQESFMDRFYSDPEELMEAIADYFYGNSDYDSKSDAEVQEAIDNEFAKYNWKQAIIVSLS